MDPVLLLKAALIGVVEGITEFLPISSTAHIRLTQAATGFHDPGEMFAVVIQLGAILAVVVLFWRRLLDLALGVMRRDPAQLRFALGLGVACIPPVVFGLLLNDWLETHVFGAHELLIIALTMGIGGLIIILVERLRPPPRHADAATIPVMTCLGIGFMQVLAMIPGVSRSGASIIGGMCLGVDRKAATEFSFFLAIPIMAGGSLLKLRKHGHVLVEDPSMAAATAVGFIVSFVVALAAIRWLLRYVATNTFVPFAWYRIALGLLIGGLIAAGVIGAGVE